jgi:lactocepin
VIIVPPGGVDDYPTLMLSDWSIPAATTGKVVGQQVIDQLEQGEKISIQLSDGILLDNPNNGQCQTFRPTVHLITLTLSRKSPHQAVIFIQP